MSTLYDRVKAGELLFLDGGTGTELALRDVPHADPCWTAHVVLENPEILREVHSSFVDVGSDIIVANSFRASLTALEACGLGDKWKEINTKSVKIAFEAIEAINPDRQVHVVASVPAALPEGVVAGTDEEEKKRSFQQADVLANAGAEAILVERISSIKRGKAVLEGAKMAGIATWAGFSCYVGDKGIPMLGGGEDTLEDALKELLPLGVRVVGIMHTPMMDVGVCLETLRQHWSGPVHVSPHAAPCPIATQQVVDACPPEEYRAKARTWIGGGVRLIGGCCGIGPEHIKAVREGVQLLG